MAGRINDNLYFKSRLRPNKKSIFRLLVIFALFFFFYQLVLFIGLDNTQTKSNYKNSELFSTVGTKNKKVKGVRYLDLPKYETDKDGMFMCIKSGVKIPYIYLNDDYCDCPDDGSDEPGTNACEKGYFYCSIQIRHPTGRGSSQKIPKYKVNDGICDCCDGSDEWNGIIMDSPLPMAVQQKLNIYHAPCFNRCTIL